MRESKKVLELLGTNPGSWQMLARCDSATIDRVQKIKAILPMDKPYTNLLAAIRDDTTLFDMGRWHQKHGCKTAHCEAGWLVHLHPQGYALEEALNSTEAAATVIVRVSRPNAPLPNFYATNEQAMAFIEARAEEEK